MVDVVPNTTQTAVLLREGVKGLGYVLGATGVISAGQVEPFTTALLSIGSAVMILAPIAQQIYITTKAQIVARAAALKDSSGNKVIQEVKLNPASPEAPAINMATPSNVVLPGAKP